jgi:hypothetical protein
LVVHAPYKHNLDSVFENIFKRGHIQSRHLALGVGEVEQLQRRTPKELSFVLRKGAQIHSGHSAYSDPRAWRDAFKLDETIHEHDRNWDALTVASNQNQVGRPNMVDPVQQ